MTIAAHQQAVGGQAEQFARAAGLSEALVAAIQQAGLWHDLGKADPRFQAWLCNGDRALAIRKKQKYGDALAKSDATPQTTAARALARRKSGYPQGGRHELLSVRLAANHIAYRYDNRFRIIKGYAIRPDFYLPEYDLYIEYWGMDTLDYQIGMLEKKKLYQQAGKKLISFYKNEKADLQRLLPERLSHHMHIGEQRACPP